MLALHLGLSKKRYQTINGIYLCSWPSKGCPWHCTRAENQSIDHHPKHTLQKLEWSVFSPSIPFWTHKTHCLMNQHHLSAFPQASPLPTLHMHMFKKRIMHVQKTVQPIRVYLVVVNIRIVNCHMYPGEPCPSKSCTLIYTGRGLNVIHPSIIPITSLYMVSRD